MNTVTILNDYIDPRPSAHIIRICSYVVGNGYVEEYAYKHGCQRLRDEFFKRTFEGHTVFDRKNILGLSSVPY